MSDEKKVYAAPYVCYRALAMRVLAVAKPGGRGDDWAVYIDAVPGNDHAAEIAAVVGYGEKADLAVAVALFPQFDPEAYRE